MTNPIPFDFLSSLVQQTLAEADVLPRRYARYGPLLSDGICFFLERLGPGRQRVLWEELMQRPESAGAEERLVALLCHLPTLHKLGQVVARDRRLQPGFRARLQKLESLSPRTTWAIVVGLLDRELPDWRRAGIILDQGVLAEGSVAVVVPFLWEKGGRDVARARVFKLLKPEIEQQLAEVMGNEQGVREANVVVDSVLLGKFLQEFVTEWPRRLRNDSRSRQFGTHLSTNDLWELLGSGPLVWTRYWLGVWSDLSASRSG
jgi:hypothetical protein